MQQMMYDDLLHSVSAVAMDMRTNNEREVRMLQTLALNSQLMDPNVSLLEKTRIARAVTVADADYVDVSVLDMSGRGYEKDSGAVFSASSQEYFTRASRGELVITDPEVNEKTKAVTMTYSYPVKDAGEAGKGFSVVADEIRKLSENSSEQSKTIGVQLEKIRTSIDDVVSASAESSAAFQLVTEKIRDTDQLVRQIRAAMQEQQAGSQQIGDALHAMNDSTAEVRTASAEMAEGNKQILSEVQKLQNATGKIKESIGEMSIGAKKIHETGTALSEINGVMSGSIEKIGSEIDLFKV